MTVLWIGLGGFLGANARYFLGRAILERYGATFPWGTFAVNLIGSLLIGVIMESLGERMIVNPAYRLFLVVGFLGGFTTFSAFAFETASLLEDDKFARAGAYVLGSNIIAITACIGGMWLVRRFA
ncbi:MAG: fluoride efflux transporter CrcB [Thermomicrobiales bacterium]